jgi:predicted nucleic acid-binding protein
VTPERARECVVLDIHVFISAVSGGNSPFESWPTPPPVTDNSAADCLGILNDAMEFKLCLSQHILEHVIRILLDPEAGLGWELAVAEEYVEVLTEMAAQGDCGVREPSEDVMASEDWEDNKILALAAECDAALIVSEDPHLLDLSPWRGIPIVRAREFAGRVYMRMTGQVRVRVTPGTD